MKSGRLLVVAIAVMVGACAAQDGQTGSGTGGTTETGGTSAGGGAVGSGGKVGSGGTPGPGSGGKVGSGGVPAQSSGGTVGSGGNAAAKGGAPGTGGTGMGGGKAGGISGGAGKGATGGSGGSAGSAANGAGGGSSTGGAGGAGVPLSGLPLKNPPVGSAGCGKATTVNSGKKMITSGGMQRSYIIDVPTDYDMNKPYRFFYTSHWVSSTAEAVQQQNFYFLKPLATAAKDPAIFLAPQALPGDPNGTWDTQKPTDQILFDDILAYVKANLCIDTTRVFATGFSYGGMMTYSLSATRQKDIRAAVGIAPANYNIYVGTKTHQPIAWMQTTGMSDTTCPWVNNGSTTQGSKYIAIEHGTDNGCTVPATIPTWTTGPHLCVDFQGCMTGTPTKVCTFNGPHTNINSDPGTSTNWIPEESWKFFTQF